ncbi:MAG: helix-turn-helix domain-containing protein [Bacteroidia bacterium]
MRSKVAARIVSETPEEVKIFTSWYADLVVRVHEIMHAKNITQKSLAEKLGKKPSEISKWLNGGHNFTLRSLAKLEAELGEQLLYIPQKTRTPVKGKSSQCLIVYTNENIAAAENFISTEVSPNEKEVYQITA